MDNDKLIMDLQKRVEHMDKQIATLDSRMVEFDRKITSVLYILAGNEHDPTDKGSVGRILELENRVEKLEKWKEKAINIVIGASLVGGASVAAIIGKIVDALK